MHKKNEPEKIYVASSRRVMLVLMSLSTIYQYMYTSLFSSALGMLPVFGGAMFMSARMAGAFAHTFLGDRRKYLTRRLRALFCVLTAITLLCSLTLIALYPVLWTSTPVWLTFAAVLSIALRSGAGPAADGPPHAAHHRRAGLLAPHGAGACGPAGGHGLDSLGQPGQRDGLAALGRLCGRRRAGALQPVARTRPAGPGGPAR